MQRRAVLGLPGLLFGAGTLQHAHADEPRRGDGYPRVLGANIGAKNYHDPAYQAQLARADMVIIGLFPGWRGDRGGDRFRQLLAELKRRNPKLLVAQYTILNESSDDLDRNPSADRVDKLNREDWWLRGADGGKRQWTRRWNAWDINFTDWSKPDAEGLRYPQWLARRDHRLYFGAAPFDAWYFDNVMVRSRVPEADWRRDGKNVSSRDPAIESAYRKAMAAHWEAAHKLAPDALLIGNADSDLSAPEFRGRLHGAFLEGLMGKSWSIEKRDGWRAMMKRYVDVRANLKAPQIVGFNVAGDPRDYAFFRYAFCSSLLGDGWFSFTDAEAGYSSIPWFDEYDVRLGKPVDPVPQQPWRDGVWRRRYEHAVALVNPETAVRSVALEPGWRRVKGLQDARANSGERVGGALDIPPRGGLLLLKD